VLEGAPAAPRRVLAVGVGLVALYLVLIIGQRAVDAYRANREIEAVRGEIAALRARNLTLQAELSNSRFEEDIERIAREELGLIKPGDKPLVLIWPSGPPGDQDAAVEADNVQPNWRTWLERFVDLEPASR